MSEATKNRFVSATPDPRRARAGMAPQEKLSSPGLACGIEFVLGAFFADTAQIL
jgi:hypothetical protein